LLQKVILVVKDPVFIKKITMTDFDSFVNHDNNYGVTNGKLFSRIAFFVRDQEWRDLRAKLSPIFTPSKTRYMYQLLVERHEDFLKFYVEKAQANGRTIEIETQDTFGRLIVDGISTALLGIEGDCVRNPNSLLFEHAKSIKEDISKISAIIYQMMPRVFKFLNLQVIRKSTELFFQTFVTQEMTRREEQNISRPDRFS
jgi:cytochrome P450